MTGPSGVTPSACDALERIVATRVNSGRDAFSAALWAGISGWLLIDLYLVITHGLIFHDATAMQVSQWDASNALGAAAFDGGIGTALLGLAMHFCVSMLWAAAYAVAALQFPVLVRRPLLSGICFGLVVFAVMIFGIVPLGHASQPGRSTSIKFANTILAHVVAFGIPVAYITAKYLNHSKHSG